MRLIDADKLKDWFSDDKGEGSWTYNVTIRMYIDNAPIVEERPTGECENCDYRKFTETFIDGVVEVMIKNGLTSVEQLSEILKGASND